MTPSAGAASGFAEVLTSASGGPPGPEPPPGAPQAPGGEVAGNEQKALPQGLDSHLPDASGAFVAIASSDKVEAPAPPKPKGAVAPDFAIAAVANAVAVAAGGFIEQAAIATTAGSASPSNAVVDSTLVEPTACAIPAGQMQPIPGPTPPDEGSSKGGFEPNQSSGSKPSDRRPASTELGSPNSDKVPTQAAKAVNVADVDPSATLVGVAPVAAIPAASRAALRVDEAGTPQNPLAPKSDDAVRGDGVGKEQPT
ncbi:MAG: hypothetical protein HY248_01060, partial [Fimbriimonas ginsengisoli]|nr:hypothetical protein [Fimbriimonas ginsengisoli]